VDICNISESFVSFHLLILLVPGVLLQQPTVQTLKPFYGLLIYKKAGTRTSTAVSTQSPRTGPGARQRPRAPAPRQLRRRKSLPPRDWWRLSETTPSHRPREDVYSPRQLAAVFLSSNIIVVVAMGGSGTARRRSGFLWLVRGLPSAEEVHRLLVFAGRIAPPQEVRRRVIHEPLITHRAHLPGSQAASCNGSHRRGCRTHITGVACRREPATNPASAQLKPWLAPLLDLVLNADVGVVDWRDDRRPDHYHLLAAGSHTVLAVAVSLVGQQEPAIGTVYSESCLLQ
jgi:hypothetical protein